MDYVVYVQLFAPLVQVLLPTAHYAKILIAMPLHAILQLLTAHLLSILVQHQLAQIVIHHVSLVLEDLVHSAHPVHLL